MGGSRLLVCTLFLTSLFAFASSPSQISGITSRTTVPFRAEPWSSTEVVPVSSSVGGPEHERGELVEERDRGTSKQQEPDLQSSRYDLSAATSVTSRIAGPASSATVNLVGKVFEGPVDENPPDSDIAAGPNHVVATVNSVVAIYSKAGTLISQTDINSFLGSIADPGCCFDLRVLYDPTNGRFIVAAGQTDFSSNSSHIYLAVSASADPTGTWYKYSLEASNTTWSDFPTIGISSTALYLTTDGIPFTGGGRAIWQATVIGLAELVSGNPNLSITKFSPIVAPSGDNVHGPVIPARTYGSPGVEYLVSTGPPGVLYIYSINTSGTPTLRSVTLNTVSYPSPGLAPQPGTTVALGGGGDAVFTAVWRNGSLWVTQGIGAGPQPGTGALVRWYEIDPVTPAVKQLGTVAGVGSAIIPAMTVRPDGQVDLVFTTSSTSQFASAAYAHRGPNDPANTMPISGIYKAGTAAYGNPRWGDISGVSPDPDGSSTWGIAEYARAGGFGTSIVQLLSPPVQPGTLALTSTPATQTVSAGQSATYTIATSGQGTAAVSLACSGLPAAAACTFNPNPVPGGSSSTTLTISTGARSAALMPGALPFALLPIAAVVVLFVPRRFRSLAGLVVLVVIAASVLAGCGGVGRSSNGGNGGGSGGGGGGGTGGTAAGTYAVTVSGSAGSASASTTVELVVR